MVFANSRIRFFKTSWLNCEQYGKNKCKKKKGTQSTVHGCSNHSNLEMEVECLTKTLSYLNLNISRTKNGRNKL